MRINSWVTFDKNEGVVKRHFFIAMLCSTAWISEGWRTEALKLSGVPHTSGLHVGLLTLLSIVSFCFSLFPVPVILLHFQSVKWIGANPPSPFS